MNFWVGSGGLQAKVDYNKPVPPLVLVRSTCIVSMDLLQRFVAGDQAASLECWTLMGPPSLESATPSYPPPLMTLAELDSARANLVFAKHVRKYMASQGGVRGVQPTYHSVSSPPTYVYHSE